LKCIGQFCSMGYNLSGSEKSFSLELVGND